MPVTITEDEGFLKFEVPSEGGTKKVILDMYEASNTYAGLCEKHDPATQPVELAREWQDWLKGQGFPPVSQGTAFRIASDVWEAVQRFKKKFERESPTAASAGSTAST